MCDGCRHILIKGCVIADGDPGLDRIQSKRLLLWPHRRYQRRFSQCGEGGAANDQHNILGPEAGCGPCWLSALGQKTRGEVVVQDTGPRGRACFSTGGPGLGPGAVGCPESPGSDC